MKPLIPNTYVLNNKYLQSILSPSTDIIDYNFSSDQIHKLNLLQILRPDIYFNKKLSDEEFYEISRNYYQKLIKDNIIYKSEDEYFLYRIDSKDHSQTGLISLLNIQDYLNNNIKPHEKTLVSKGKERAEQLSKVKFQLCPIYLFYDDQNIDLDLDIHHEKKPIIKFKSGNYTHSIYKTKSDFSGINFKELYVADGHHRIEGFAQLDVKKDTKFMAIIFPKSKCSNMAYDRSVKFPTDYDKDSFIRDLEKYFYIEELKYHENIDRFFVIYFKGKFLKIDLKNEFSTNGADCIDFAEFILKEILDIKDETNDERVEFVPPTLGTDYLINQVDTGIRDISTMMRPVSMDLVIDYSKNKKFMPPKATWFDPKPLDGLFFYNIIE
tara:strand:+ start:411 stop:1553 length:1143 start_codon:yes stop_codon:yes gene_type:complete